MRLLFSFLLVLFYFTSIFAQFRPDRIAVARPGKAIGVRTVGKNVLQIQTGINYKDIEDKDTNTGKTTFNPKITIRYGFWELIELSTVIGYKRDKNIAIDEIYTQDGIHTTQLGIRFSLSKNKGIQPAAALQYRLLFPLQSTPYQNSFLGSRLILATSHRIKKIGIVSNWGLTWGGNSGQPSYDYVLKLSYGLTKKIGTFVEMYGPINSSIVTNFDTGFSFLAKENIQFDIFGGWEGTKSRNSFFIETGVSWRFHKRTE